MPYTFDELNGLSEEEKALALQILEQFSSSGKSTLYNDLLYEDYREIPVDIETFITDDNYLGQAWKDAAGKLKMYPFWMEQLKKLFPTNVDTDYNILLEILVGFYTIFSPNCFPANKWKCKCPTSCPPSFPQLTITL